MIEMLKTWYVRRFSDPQAMGLFAILLFGFILIYFLSDLIAPLLVAISFRMARSLVKYTLKMSKTTR